MSRNKNKVANANFNRKQKPDQSKPWDYKVINYRSTSVANDHDIDKINQCHKSKFTCDIHVPSNPVSYLKIYAKHTITYEEYCSHKDNDGLISLDCEFSIYFPPQVCAYILPTIYRKHCNNSGIDGNINDELDAENYLETQLRHYRNSLVQYPNTYKPIKTCLPIPISRNEFNQKTGPVNELKYEPVCNFNYKQTCDLVDNNDISNPCHTIVVSGPVSQMSSTLWADENEEDEDEDEEEYQNNYPDQCNILTRSSSLCVTPPQPKKLDFVLATLSHPEGYLTPSLDDIVKDQSSAHVLDYHPSTTLQTLLSKRVTCRQSKLPKTKYCTHTKSTVENDQFDPTNMQVDLGPYEPFVITSDFPDAHKVPVFYSGQLIAEVLLEPSLSRYNNHTNDSCALCQKTKMRFQFQNL